VSLEITDRDAWTDHVLTPLCRSAFGCTPDRKTHFGSPDSPTPCAARLADARNELGEIKAALKRLDGSRDPRAAAAAAVLEPALAAASDRVGFLAGLEAALDKATEAHGAAVAAVAAANHRLNNCEPSDAAAASIALATAQAELRAAHRSGLALLERWRSSAAPCCPELAAAMQRAAELTRAIDDLRTAAKDPSPLAIVCEGPSTDPHWAAIVKGRQARAKGAQ